ncbi:MAG: hypothetical protein LBI05_10710 [Planctomycetaceae bacterium]|jgi:hypothetical protein|nr:hypothetical protein [Planctomycetaceae bacterium]
MRNILLSMTILAVLALTTGCGDGTIATLKVTGTITLDGVPLPNANINFTPKSEGQGNPGYAVTDEKGTYKLQTLLGAAEAGTTPGDYGVSITCVESGRVVESTRGSTSDAPPPPMTRPQSLIPERYGSTATSGLSATVEKGKLVHDFALTSE